MSLGILSACASLCACFSSLLSLANALCVMAARCKEPSGFYVETRIITLNCTPIAMDFLVEIRLIHTYMYTYVYVYVYVYVLLAILRSVGCVGLGVITVNGGWLGYVGHVG